MNREQKERPTSPLELAEHFNLASEARLVASAMVKYGGSFVHCLGKALYRADPQNTMKIKQFWPEYWAKYLAMGETEKAEGDLVDGPDTE